MHATEAHAVVGQVTLDVLTPVFRPGDMIAVLYKNNVEVGGCYCALMLGKRCVGGHT